MPQKILLLLVALWPDLAISASNSMPAARLHVRMIDGEAYRFTSKLTRIAAINFTLDFHHNAGKPAVHETLIRISSTYGTPSHEAFEISHLTKFDFDTTALPESKVTEATLDSAEVVVFNNVAGMYRLPKTDSVAAKAIEMAVGRGKSVLLIHGSSESSGSGWPFYEQVLFPWKFSGHRPISNHPVYRNEEEMQHLVLEGVLESGTVASEVPMGIDALGSVIIQSEVPIRNVALEDMIYRPNPLETQGNLSEVTCLLRYEPYFWQGTSIEDIHPGGHAFSWMWSTGAGKAAYFSQGHDMQDLDSFDAGTGDLERYLAQMLFYLAGYHRELCGESVPCEGLPLVDENDHLVGSFGEDSLPTNSLNHPFPTQENRPGNYAALDLIGKIVAEARWMSELQALLAQKSVPAGVYFLAIRSKGRFQILRRIGVPGSVEGPL